MRLIDCFYLKSKFFIISILLKQNQIYQIKIDKKITKNIDQ